MAKKALKKKAPTLPNVNDFPELLAPIRDRLANKYVYIDRCGEGKTGVTFRLGLITNPDFYVCLKTVRESMRVPAIISEVRSSLENELQILKKMRHRCLPAIVENGVSHELPYYICTFHSGKTFSEERANKRRLRIAESFSVIAELFDVIEYVHSQGRMHCDLHGSNILLGASPLRDGILVVDFGSGHRISDSSSDTVNRGNPGFKPPGSLRKDREDVSRVNFEHEFKESDIIAAGKLLTQMDECFVGEAAPLIKEEYRRFCEDLQASRMSDWTQIRERLATVFDPMRSINANSDLFVYDDSRRESITIPIAGSVNVGGPSIAIINTPEFQRLRNIKQLSFCDWQFPGACHTRFEHALGVYAVACMAVNSLAYDRGFRANFGPIDVRGFLLASLIHDVGHYPYAHVIEHYSAGRFPGESNREARASVSHETIAMQLIDGNSKFKDIAVNAWGREAVNSCARVLAGKEGALSRLLDGSLDIDKMDYLVRDAYHAGLPFGASFDPHRLCESITCDLFGKEIYGRADSIAAIEGFVMLQDQLYGALYWHPVVRGVHAMFHAIVVHIVAKDAVALKTLASGLQSVGSEAEAIDKVIVPKLLESQFLSDKQQRRDRLIRMARAIGSSDTREMFREAWTYRFADAESRKSPTNVYRTIIQQPSETGSLNIIDWPNVTKLRQSYLDAFRTLKCPVHTDMDVLVDVPFGKGPKRLAMVFSSDGGEPIRIDEVTHLKKSAFDQPVHHWSPIRVFVSPELFPHFIANSNAIRSLAENSYLHIEPKDRDAD